MCGGESLLALEEGHICGPYVSAEALTERCELLLFWELDAGVQLASEDWTSDCSAHLILLQRITFFDALIKFSSLMLIK